jgi:hypothetical protein
LAPSRVPPKSPWRNLPRPSGADSKYPSDRHVFDLEQTDYVEARKSRRCGFKPDTSCHVTRVCGCPGKPRPNAAGRIDQHVELDKGPERRAVGTEAMPCPPGNGRHRIAERIEMDSGPKQDPGRNGRGKWWAL